MEGDERGDVERVEKVGVLTLTDLCQLTFCVNAEEGREGEVSRLAIKLVICRLNIKKERFA